MAYSQLTENERYALAALHASGMSLRQIAKVLCRAASTISREYKRNATRYDGKYRAQRAQAYAVRRRRQGRAGSRFGPERYEQVDRLLRRRWSPEQVAGVLRRRVRGQMSRSTIYRHLHRDKAAGGDLWRHMRGMTKKWRKRYRSQDWRGTLRGKRLIDDRPKAAHSRSRIGHWEADTVIGKDGRNCVLTMVERKTGLGEVVKMRARTKEEANRALEEVLKRHGRRIKTITFDNGTEFHGYEQIEAKFDVKCYFARPYHSWERGSNENYNGLLRQYLPKGCCMKLLTQARCNEIQREINDRPRKRYRFKAPSQLYYGSNAVLHLV